jgi:DNA processing protein
VGARPLFTIEPNYPPALAAIGAPPPLIYVKGNTGLLIRPMVAVVGARNGSAAGHKLARLFGAALGAAGFVVVSGLARGIDAAAHQAALRHGTVAVLAGGTDNIYPPENAELQRAIGEEGCLISENPPGFVPRAQDFPRRNRIISGVSLGVVIIEAARRSGTLITARMAAEQSREIFVVPGHPLDPRAEGTNRLLKSGEVHLVTEPEDVIRVLAPMVREPPMVFADLSADTPEPMRGQASQLPDIGPDDRDRLLAALGPAPIDVDELARATGLPVRSLQIALVELALAGRIERHGHQMVSLAL